MKNSITLVLGLMSCTLMAQQTKKVLFIGNSYTAQNNMTSMIDSLATSEGNTLIYEVLAPGGETLKSHAASSLTYAKIREQKWDYVVLQEQSQIPSFPWSQFNSDCVPFAKQLVDSIRRNNECTIPLFFGTWGRENGDSQWDSTNTFLKMNTRLYNSYQYLAKQNAAHFIAVGMAYDAIKEPGGGAVSFDELYEPDESHPTKEASYLIACMFYQKMFAKKNKYNLYTAGLATFYSYYLQQIADLAINNNKNNSTFFPKADFSVENSTGSKNVIFTDKTIGGVAYLWDFGDNNSSAQKNPVHTYDTFGIYGIGQYVKNACNFYDTSLLVLRVFGQQTTHVVEVEENELNIFPNTSYQILNSNIDNPIVSLTNVEGKNVDFIRLSETSISIEKLPNGLYFVQTKNGIARIMKL